MGIMTITSEIVGYLKEQNTGVSIKATPQALLAPSGYTMLEYQKIILVWVDSIPYYGSKPLFENQNASQLPIPKNIRIVVSIGFRSLEESPELDTLIEAIEQQLINLKLDNLTPLYPVNMTKISVDDNNVYWRQLYLDTTMKMRIPVHTL